MKIGALTPKINMNIRTLTPKIHTFIIFADKINEI